MRLYWSLKSVPELAGLSPAERRRVWQAAWRESGGMSYAEMAVLGLAIALGATLGPLGVGLFVGIVVFPIMSHMVKRLRPAMIAARRRLGLGMATASGDA